MDIEELAFKDRKNLAQLNELDLLDIIEFLQNDRKQWVGIFTKTHNGNVEIRKENRELKQKYENAVTDYETTMFEKEQLNSLVNSCQEEIRKLKKQLEESKDNYNCLLKQKEQFEYIMSKQVDYQGQQKEFIKWLEDYLNLFDDMDIEEQASYDTIEEILRKYKEIIGDDK